MTDPIQEFATPPTPPPPPRQPQARFRILTVLVIVGVIVAVALAIGNQQNFGTIGQGGVNAKLLPEVGEIAPEIVTFDSSGQLVQLSDYRGQPVWLNFWGSWCPPCRAEFPDVQAAYEDLNADGLVMLGIAVGEDPLTAQDYADRMGGTFPVLASPGYLASIIPEDAPAALEAAQELATSYIVNNYPTHIFINRDGTVGAVVLSQMSYEDMMKYGGQVIDSPMPDGMSVVLPAATPTAKMPSDED